MAQEYELSAFDTGKEPYVDQHGNTWCTAVFVGEGEPVKWVVKDPTQVKIGNSYYGTITEEKSKAGKPYLRFRREKVPEGSTGPSSDKPTEEYWENKQAQIKAQWAIGQAVQLHIAVTANGGEEAQGIEATAKELFAMVDRVANPIDQNDRDIINLNDVPL